MKQFTEARIERAKAEIQGLQREVARLEACERKATEVNGIEKWLGYEFESSSQLTAEFAKFRKDFKKHIANCLPAGATLVNVSGGHFEVSGFLKRDNRYVYFSISDVRHWQDEWYNHILIRTAEGEKDYTGGTNNYTTLPQFTLSVENLLST